MKDSTGVRPVVAVGLMVLAVLVGGGCASRHHPTVTYPDGTVMLRPSETPIRIIDPTVLDPESSAQLVFWGAQVEDVGPIPGGGMFAFNGSRLWLTFDGGVSWQPGGRAFFSFDPSPYKVATTDRDHFWLMRSELTGYPDAGDQVLSLARTSDGGTTWRHAFIANPFDPTIDPEIVFADSQHGYAYWSNEGRMTIERTEDGGATWSRLTPVPIGGRMSASAPNVLWLAASSATTCNPCGEPLLRVSQDSGTSWSVVHLPGFENGLASPAGTAILTPPQFLTADMGYVAVTDKGPVTSTHMFATVTGGFSWYPIAEAPFAIDRLWTPDGVVWHGIAVDSNATVTIVASTDAGKTWRQTPTSMPVDQLQGPWFVDAQHGVMAAVHDTQHEISPVLWVTSDGGATWKPAHIGD